MMTNFTHQLNDDHILGDSPSLASLRLDSEDIASIADQGFISKERRGRRTYHKLRFRRHGRQQVRYVGDAGRADALQMELNVLQRDLQLRRRIAVLTRSVTSELRTAREKLRPLAESRGFYFHGHAPRKRRNTTNEQVQR
jgi:hypothetical protein